MRDPGSLLRDSCRLTPSETLLQRSPGSTLRLFLVKLTALGSKHISRKSSAKHSHHSRIKTMPTSSVETFAVLELITLSIGSSEPIARLFQLHLLHAHARSADLTMAQLRAVSNVALTSSFSVVLKRVHGWLFNFGQPRCKAAVQVG